MTLPSDLTTPVPAGIIDQLVTHWHPYDTGPVGMARFVEPAVDALREAHVAGPPYELKVVDLVLLGKYVEPGNRVILAALMTPEAVDVADRFVLVLKRLVDIMDDGFTINQAATINAAETEMRRGLLSVVVVAPERG